MAHPQVDVIVLLRILHKLYLEVVTDLGEDTREIAGCEVAEHVALVHRYEDQMNV